jgi:phage baseplate assembly protein W
MAIKRISRSFKDISLSFDRHPITGDILTLTNERAITRSIRNIVETIPSERFFNTDFGSDVRSSLFNNMDYGIIGIIQDQILQAIRNYEPRVENVDVDINPLFDNNSLDVTVIFDIIGQDFPTQQFTFVLEATR